MAKQDSQDNSSIKIPVIPLRGIVAYPKLTLAFDAGRAGTLSALNKALKSDRKVLLLAQKDLEIEEPKAGDLYRVGTVADIIQVLEVKNDYYKILTEGGYRAKVVRLIRRGKGYYMAEIIEYPRTPFHIVAKRIDELQLEAMHREIINLFETYAIETGFIPPDAISFAKTLKNYDQLIDLVSVHVNFKHENKQALLEEQNLEKD